MFRILGFVHRIKNCNYSCTFVQIFIIYIYFEGIDNSICTYGGLLSYKNGHILSIQTISRGKDPLKLSPMAPLRVLLINSKVSRNTKAQVLKVKENRINLLPKVTEHIMEALDMVAIECLNTLELLVDTTSKLNDNINYKDKKNDNETSRKLFHKLEVSLENF